jgi:hypothetical protein
MASMDEANHCRGKGGGAGVRVGININGVPGDFFRTYKGFRQGDPLSPLLFNLVSDALASMLDKARLAREIKGLVPDLIEGSFTSPIRR